jgi:hypothetical protein
MPTMPTLTNARWILIAGLALGCGSSVTSAEPDAGSGSADSGPRLDAPADAPAACTLPFGGVCPAGQSCPIPNDCNSCYCNGGGGPALCTSLPCAVDAGAARDTGPGFDASPVGCRSARDCGGGQECRFRTAGCGMVGACGTITDCADVQLYCDCVGDTFRDCPGGPQRPWVSLGACAGDGGTSTDAAPSSEAAACAGAHVGRGGGYCADARDAVLPIACCTDWNCDQRLAACASVPPACPSGEVATVTGGCYGPCVPVTLCAPIRCDAMCPAGWTCDVDAHTCRYGG